MTTSAGTRRCTRSCYAGSTLFVTAWRASATWHTHPSLQPVTFETVLLENWLDGRKWGGMRELGDAKRKKKQESVKPGFHVLSIAEIPQELEVWDSLL